VGTLARVKSERKDIVGVSAGTDAVVCLRGKAEGRSFPLQGDAVVLGSAADCGIRVEDEGVLPRHAALEKRREAWFLRALDHGRPIESDGRLVTELRLHQGLQFVLGSARFRFQSARTAIEALPVTGADLAGQPEAVARLQAAHEAILRETGRIIVGQNKVLNQILVALFARGHCLLIGVPGLAKTLMVRVLGGTLDLDSKRIQFTPDLMPADITGTDILEEDAASRNRRFRFSRGPLFANLLLADEINRTPPKTQAALLEAMQERRVTAAGLSYDLPEPFMVLATQNPIEQEGTYPLPEAQLDRFMFCVHVSYPGADEEKRIITETTRDIHWEVERVLDGEAILQLQHVVRQVPVSDHVATYATALVRATRPDTPGAPDFIQRWVRWGAGPRAGQYLLLAAKAHVLLQGRASVSCADVREYALPVMRHRLFCNFAATSEGVTTDQIIEKLLAAVPEPSY
jgi:MoxR-like ATPase